MILSKWWILCLALLVLPAGIHAQTDILSLEEAVEMFNENSLQRELAKLDELRKKGEAVQYKSYFNPEVSVFREQLNAGTLDYQETTYQVSQPLELLGQPFLRSQSAEESQKAAELEYKYSQQILIQRVKSLYTEYWYLKNKLEVYDQGLHVINKALEAAEARQAEGAFSGIRVQRFRIEHNRYLKDRYEAELAMIETGNELASMIFPSDSAQQEINIQDSLTVVPLAEEKETFTQYALSNRSDLQALDRHYEASNLRLKVEKRELFPDLNLNFGYKNQSDGSEGFVIGGSIKLPLFNQNRGSITTAEATKRTVETSLQLRRQTVRNQVDAAWKRVMNIYNQWESMRENPVSDSMLDTVLASYQEGRSSLVELLDATKAYVDGRTLQYEMIAGYNQALFEMDRLTSGKISSTQTYSDQ